MSSRWQTRAFLSRARRRAFALLCLLACCTSPPQNSPHTAQAWQPTDLQTAIGRWDGDDAETFGIVRTIEVDAAGNVYVLGEQTADIRVFDRYGSYITSYSRRGQGPQELLGIRGSDLDSKGVLHVADAGNARISTFELNGDSLAFTGVTRLTFRPEDVCAMAARRFVLHQPRSLGVPTISEIDENGSVLRSFASPEEPQDSEQRREMRGSHHMLNWSFIACDEATRTILKFNQFVPVVRAFSIDGAALWETTLEGYVPWQFTRNRRGQCCRYRPDPHDGLSHSGRSVVTDRDGNALLGLQIEGPGSGENLRHELLVLNASSGQVIERHRVFGIVGAVGNGLIFTHAEAPFPQVRIFGTR